MSKQLTIFDVVGDTPLSPTNDLGDTKKPGLGRYFARGQTKDLEPAIFIQKYSPNGRKTKYFRLKYRVGKKTNEIHIRGGNVNSKLAQYRARELQKMIDRGAKLAEIIALADDYGS